MLVQFLFGGIIVPHILMIFTYKIVLLFQAPYYLGELYMLTYFEIWQNRNRENFQYVKTNNYDSVNNIYPYHSFMAYALGPTKKQQLIRQVRWHPLLIAIKVNVDGSYIGNPDNAGF